MQGFPLPPGPPTGAEPSSIVSPNHPYYGTPQPTPGGPNTNNQRYHEEVLGHYWHLLGHYHHTSNSHLNLISVLEKNRFPCNILIVFIRVEAPVRRSIHPTAIL